MFFVARSPGSGVQDDRRPRLILLSTSANYDGDFLKNVELASFSVNEVTSPAARDRTVIAAVRSREESVVLVKKFFFLRNGEIRFSDVNVFNNKNLKLCVLS